MSGWIKLHRSIKKHWIFQDAEKLRAWLIILIEVNHDENKVNLGNLLLTCKRGESLKSLDTWAKLFGNNWNKSKVRRFFELLKKDSMIVLKSEQKTTRLTVCKYDSYQDTRNEDETQVTRKRNASDTQATPNKNVKNVKNILDREILFKKELELYQKEYPIEMLTKFFIYWSEPNQQKTKMKFEIEKTWDLKRRLRRWSDNNKK